MLDAEIRKAIIGQDRLVERVLIGLLADGHVLLEGVPGLAKTQDDCKVFFYSFMVSLSNHRWLERASFDKLRMIRNQ